MVVGLHVLYLVIIYLWIVRNETYEEEDSSPEWWIWVIIGAVVLLVILGVICYFRRRAWRIADRQLSDRHQLSDLPTRDDNPEHFVNIYIKKKKERKKQKYLFFKLFLFALWCFCVQINLIFCFFFFFFYSVFIIFIFCFVKIHICCAKVGYLINSRREFWVLIFVFSHV